MVRPAVATWVSMSSASACPSRAATASWSSRVRRSRPVPVTTCTASRTSRRTRCAASTALVRTVGEPGRDQRAEDGHVAQAAVGLLEVRLEALGEVAVAGVPRLEPVDELREAAAGVGTPVVRHRGPGRRDDLGVTRDALQVQQADSGGQVARGHGAALVDGAHRVVEAAPRRPRRGTRCGRPGPAGRSAGEGPAVVQEDEVDVAERSGVTAGQAAHGGQRDALRCDGPGGPPATRWSASPG